MEITREQALALANDETVKLSNGMTLRFRRTPDHDTTLNEFDCYGKTEWVPAGDRSRPAGFDGMAEKIWSYNDWCWWQPPADLRSGWHNYEHKNSLRTTVRNIVSFGFDIYWLELCHGTNAYGDPIVVEYTVMGGNEPLQSDDDVADTLIDMAADIEIPVNLETQKEMEDQ